MQIAGLDVEGAMDQETRCQHYHSEKDVIAIKFYCCQTYYPCYLCHEERGCGQHAVWPAKEFDQKAVLCGNCKTELTINEYINNENTCPSCGTLFNAGCSLHHHLYFEKLPK